MKKRNVWHEAAPDDDITSIALSYGIKDWKQIWSHKENEEIKKTRSNPHTLYKGDKIWIPEFIPKEFDISTNEKKTFVLYQPKTVIQIFLHDDSGNPYGNVRYEVWINGKRYNKEDKHTREDGLIFEHVPVVKEIELRVWFPVLKKIEENPDEPIETGDPEDFYINDDPWSCDNEELYHESLLQEDPEKYESFFLHPGKLDPINTIEGIQQRLDALGFSYGDELGNPSTITQNAILAFQDNYGLEQTGSIDWKNIEKDKTVKKISEVFENTEKS